MTKIEGNLIYDSAERTKTYMYSPNDIHLIEHMICRLDDDYFTDTKLLKNSGVYILISNTNIYSKSAPQVYIGQSMNIQRRLKEHLRKKSFWDYAIVFQLTEEMFNDAQIRYFEYKFIVEAINCRRCYLTENCQIPKEPYLNKNDKMYADEIYSKMKMLIAFSGYTFLNADEFNTNKLNEEYEDNCVCEPVEEYGSISEENNNSSVPKNNIVKRIAKEINILKNKNTHNCYNMSYYDDYEEDDIYSYIINGKDYHAELIPVGDKFMIMPYGTVYKNISKEMLDKYSSQIDSISCNILKDITVESLEEAAYLVTGIADENLCKIHYN